MPLCKRLDIFGIRVNKLRLAHFSKFHEEIRDMTFDDGDAVLPKLFDNI